MTTYQSPSRSSRTLRKAPQGLHSTASEHRTAEVVSSAASVSRDDSRVQSLVLAFSGQDMIKSILRDYQSDSSVTAEVREASAGDNLLIQEETKTALAMIAVRLHVNVTTDGAASASGASRASVGRRACDKTKLRVVRFLLGRTESTKVKGQGKHGPA